MKKKTQEYKGQRLLWTIIFVAIIVVARIYFIKLGDYENWSGIGLAFNIIAGAAVAYVGYQYSKHAHKE